MNTKVECFDRKAILQMAHEEIIQLFQHTTRTEKERLMIATLNATAKVEYWMDEDVRERLTGGLAHRCIYGVMTKDCYSHRASELIALCANLQVSIATFGVPINKGPLTGDLAQRGYGTVLEHSLAVHEDATVNLIIKTFILNDFSPIFTEDKNTWV